MSSESHIVQQTQRRSRINTMMDIASAIRELLCRPAIPVGMKELMLKVEDDAWKILRDELGTYFEGGR